jgi:multidrug resistance efflux pump
VQRVPVKIVFDGPLPKGLDIAPGMSVVPRVRVR